MNAGGFGEQHPHFQNEGWFYYIMASILLENGLCHDVRVPTPYEEK
jgi:hypothetical protein